MINQLEEYLRPANRRFSVKDIVHHKNRNWSGERYVIPQRDLWENMRFTIDFIESYIVPPIESRIRQQAVISVQSGYRSPSYNRLVGGSPNSMHVRFAALDLKPVNFNMMLFREICDEVFWEYGIHYNMGLGFYDTFIHIDASQNKLRKAPYTWFRINSQNIRRERGQLVPASGTGSPMSMEGGDGSTMPSDDYLFDEGVQKRLHLDVMDMGRFLTPEEYRKGIVAQIYYVSDWHLSAASNSENLSNKDMQASGESDQSLMSVDDAIRDINSTPDSPPAGEVNYDRDRGDLSLDPRKRYIMSLVDAEFYRRRLGSRQVPAVTGPFNPYPVAGFPALVMTPGRPIIGMAESVSHHIDVASGSGTTSVSISQPRYWDEGDVWHWAGGWSMDDWSNTQSPKSNYRHLYQRFPLWQNRHTVATNNYDFSTRSVTRSTPLDNFYKFILGCSAIPYVSNNKDKVSNTEVLEAAIRDRRPGNFEVNPETLEIKDYNEYIASLDDQNKFRPGTLAFDLFGHMEPYDSNESTASVQSQVEYTERYGVTERELLVDFLENKYDEHKGVVVLKGRTFGEKGNNLQRSIVDYIKDIERRSLSAPK